MQTEQSRAILAAHDNVDLALANLRNAAAMSTDDPRATEMLEGAGDAYASAIAKRRGVEQGAIDTLPPRPPEGSGPAITEPPSPGEAFADPGVALWIISDGAGAGYVAPQRPENIADDSVALVLTTDADFKGEPFPAGATVAIPLTALSATAPEPQEAVKPAEDADGAAKA